MALNLCSFVGLRARQTSDGNEHNKLDRSIANTLVLKFLAFCVAGYACTGFAQAQDMQKVVQTSSGIVSLTTARPAYWGSASIYSGMWSESRLPAFPYNLVTGNLRHRKAYMVGGIASFHLLDFGLDLFRSGYRLDGFSIEAEAQVHKHFGLQTHTETVAALVIRTGEIHLTRALSMNMAWGNGVSYALGRPAYEMGVGGIRGVGTYRTQYHMSFETAFTLRSAPQVSAFLRLHHRSGIYGVISPRKTGSNYLGGGLRFTFLK